MWVLGPVSACAALLLILAAGASASSVSVETVLDDGSEDPGLCSLREATLAVGSMGTADCVADAPEDIDTIDFDGLTGPGPHVIDAENGYNLIKTVTIDASGAAGEVRVDGADATGGLANFGFLAKADDIIIKGLSITGWSQTGIKIDTNNSSTAGVDGVQVIDNLIGTNEAGQPLGNLSAGVAVGLPTASTADDPDNTLIQGNVISTNGVGVQVRGSDTNGTIIRGNLIGTNPAGTAALANTSDGVRVSGDTDGVTIGGDGAGEGNLIAGNVGNGVLLSAPGAATTTNVTIRGNTIGLGQSGASLGNIDAGVAIDGDVDGTDVHDNTISANGVAGVSLGDDPGDGPDLTTIRGNRIGTNPSGTAVRSNTGPAVLVAGNEGGPVDTTIGGTVPGGGACVDPCNVIGGTGISIPHSAGSGTAVLGNHIGVNQFGTGALPVAGASGAGVIVAGADDVVIGSPAGPNTIGSTTIAGVRMDSGVSGGTIQSNLIGTRSDGTGDVGNDNHGIELQNASGVLIGGIEPGEGNTIANNGTDGVRVGFFGTGNPIVGNRIFDNGTLGIDLEDSGGSGPTPNDTGDLDPGANNLQNFTDIAGVAETNSIRIVGRLVSAGTTDYRIEVFTNPTPHPNGLGDGEELVDVLEVETQPGGTLDIDETVDGTLGPGETISLTVTELDGGGNPVETSEFAPPRTDGYCPSNAVILGPVLAGSGSEDTIVGTAGDDFICGLGGNDTINGAGGDDVIIGGAQDDLVAGGPGNDTIIGDAGTDTLSMAGAPGASQVDLALGTATGDGSDNIRGFERVIGSPFNDILLGSAAGDTLDGAGGNDTVSGRAGPDSMLGGPGNDTLQAADGEADAAINCGPGSDVANADHVGIDPDAIYVGCETINRADLLAPTLRVSGKKKQKSKKKIVARATCDEVCDLEATGTIKIAKIKKGKPKGRKKFKLKPASKANVAAGKQQKLTLKIKGKKAKRLLKRALKSKRATSKATIRVTAADQAGNASGTEKFKVKIKKKRKK